MKTYVERLRDIVYDASDLCADATDYAMEIAGEEGVTFARGVAHKLEEALGPLLSALEAAEQEGL